MKHTVWSLHPIYIQQYTHHAATNSWYIHGQSLVVIKKVQSFVACGIMYYQLSAYGKEKRKN